MKQHKLHINAKSVLACIKVTWKSIEHSNPHWVPYTKRGNLALNYITYCGRDKTRPNIRVLILDSTFYVVDINHLGMSNTFEHSQGAFNTLILTCIM